MKKIQIAPSVLAADMLAIGDDVRRAEASGADLLHLDVMDGVYVPNISFGFDVIKAIRKAVSIPLDVHMMTVRPDKYIDRLAEIGADSVTIHEHTCEDTREALEAIKRRGMGCALAIKPKESAEIIAPYADIIDMALIMTVEPGFGGQKFMADMMPKIDRVREILAEADSDADIEVDGGINAENAPLCVEHGVNILVAGTYLFKADDMRNNCDALRGV